MIMLSDGKGWIRNTGEGGRDGKQMEQLDSCNRWDGMHDRRQMGDIRQVHRSTYALRHGSITYTDPPEHPFKNCLQKYLAEFL